MWLGMRNCINSMLSTYYLQYLLTKYYDLRPSGVACLGTLAAAAEAGLRCVRSAVGLVLEVRRNHCQTHTAITSLSGWQRKVRKGEKADDD